MVVDNCGRYVGVNKEYTASMDTTKQLGEKRTSSLPHYLGQDCCQKQPKSGGVGKYCEWWVVLSAVVVVVLVAGGIVLAWLLL